MEPILLCGGRRSGRTAMIRRLLDGIRMPVFGYETLTLATRNDGYHEIYLYPYGVREPACREENHVADCNTRDRIIRPQVFDTLGADCLYAQKSGVLVMDEIGFMESEAEVFCRAVLDRLDSELPILAAVRTGIDTPFLRQVTTHKSARVYAMAPERFDRIYEELRPLVLSWDAQWKEAQRPC